MSGPEPRPTKILELQHTHTEGGRYGLKTVSCVIVRARRLHAKTLLRAIAMAFGRGRKNGRGGGRVGYVARAPAPPEWELINFHDSSGLDDRGFLLPLGKLLGAITVNINAGKFFAVGIVHGDLPMVVLATLVTLHAAGLLKLMLSHFGWVPPLWRLWQVCRSRASNKLEVNVPILFLTAVTGFECHFG
jgi:hypothetical protein